MILHLNNTRRDSIIATTNEVVSTLLSLVDEGCLQPERFARMRVHLDWLQYKQNFREPVLMLQTAGEQPEGPASVEIRIDSRQVTPGSLR
ncbi:MAG: hypothetical protein ACRD3B_20260, partial [Candidatus Sulfotelmatobacter sp.]